MALHWGEVHVGALRNQYASVRVKIPSGRYNLKLVVAVAFFSCSGREDFHLYNNFGCITRDGRSEILMIITDKNNTVLLPGPDGYSHDGNLSRSSFVTFKDPIDLVHGQELRIWHKNDLDDVSEDDNFGVSYMRVLALKLN